MNNNQYIRKIKEELSVLGVKESGILLVHTSLETLGKIEGGAETVIKALLSTLGSEGTLIIPTLTYKSVDGIENMMFSAKDTPSDVGELSEYFRTMPGVIRSIHPTHSACGYGKYAKDLLKEHELDRTPCGPHSPYRLIKELGGQILFLGCGLDKNISMHGIEELVEPPFLFEGMCEYKIFNNTREKFYAKYKKHDFKEVIQRYERLENILTDRDMIKGKVLQADCYLIEASEMWKKASQLMKKDLYYFVDKINN